MYSEVLHNLKQNKPFSRLLMLINVGGAGGLVAESSWLLSTFNFEYSQAGIIGDLGVMAVASSAAVIQGTRVFSTSEIVQPDDPEDPEDPDREDIPANLIEIDFAKSPFRPDQEAA